MRQPIPWLSLLIVGVCVLPAFAEDAEKSIEDMLRGAQAGMPFTDFVEAHPEAVYSDETLRETAVSKDAPGALLIVHTEDPFLGLYSFANFGFKDGKLYELVAVWSGEVEDIRGKCATFLSSAMKRHGKDYTRKSIRVFPNSKEERPVAVFYWEKDNVASLAFFTPPPADAPSGPGTLTYAQFAKDSAFLQDIFVTTPTTEEQHDQAWKDMAGIVDALK